ncbi:DUF4880 domain-containing protein [Achromobacter xylosoxidans]
MSAGAAGIPEPILAQGLEWLVVMWSGEATADERAAWQRWRNAHPDHERAWQQVQRLDARLLGVSPEASARALASSGRQAGRRKALRLMGFGLLGAGAAGLAAGRLPWAAYAADYRTAVGERREVLLEDGTRFTLNSDSAVDVQYSAGARRLVLRRGELYVATGHGALAAGRPSRSPRNTAACWRWARATASRSSATACGSACTKARSRSSRGKAPRCDCRPARPPASPRIRPRCCRPPPPPRPPGCGANWWPTACG